MRFSWSGLAVLWLAAVVMGALAAPYLAPHPPRQPVAEPLTRPNETLWLGADALGRDAWSRLLYGGRVSLAASLLSAAITISLGTLTGLLATLFPGPVDRTLRAAINATLAIPGLLLAMVLVAGMGPGLRTVVLAVGFGGAPGFARLSRTAFHALLERGYVKAARAMGAGRPWIARLHLLPNALPALLPLATVHIAWAFMGTTTLTFLGFSGDPALPEWGAMLNAGRLHLIAHPRLALAPGLAISLTIMAFHTLGGWLGRVLDPKARHIQRPAPPGAPTTPAASGPGSS